jgi:hypothetical protein
VITVTTPDNRIEKLTERVLKPSKRDPRPPEAED